MLNYGNVTIGNSKNLTVVIVIQKVDPMTHGRINPAWTNKSRYCISWIDNTWLVKGASSDLNSHSLFDYHSRMSDRLSHQKVKTQV
jgi:hypothetical protein